MECKSFEAEEAIKSLESFINLYGIPKKMKSDKGSAFIPTSYKEFRRKEISKKNLVHRGYTPAAGGRTRNTKSKELHYCQFRRQDRFYRKHKMNIESDALHHTYRTHNTPT